VNQDLDTLWNADIYIMTLNEQKELNDMVEIFKTRGNSVTLLALREWEV